METNQPGLVVTIGDEKFSFKDDVSNIKKALDAHGIVLLKGTTELENTAVMKADEYSAITHQIVLNEVLI